MAAVVMDIDVIAAGREKASETLVAGGVFGQAVIDLHHGRGAIAIAGTWRTASVAPVGLEWGKAEKSLIAYWPWPAG
jgi:hypothetical protein